MGGVGRLRHSRSQPLAESEKGRSGEGLFKGYGTLATVCLLLLMIEILHDFVYQYVQKLKELW